MDIRFILSNNIVFYRIKNSWTQEYLAEQLRTSCAYISELENGKRNISIDQLANLAHIFNIEPHELLINRKTVEIRRVKRRKK